MLFAFPVWLLRGKAHFKRQVAMRANLGVAYLPIRDDVLAFLREEKGAGREIILVTDSDYEAAVAVAERHDLFSDIWARIRLPSDSSMVLMIAEDSSRSCRAIMLMRSASSPCFGTSPRPALKTRTVCPIWT